jgi:hypothetical protein
MNPSIVQVFQPGYPCTWKLLCRILISISKLLLDEHTTALDKISVGKVRKRVKRVDLMPGIAVRGFSFGACGRLLG